MHRSRERQKFAELTPRFGGGHRRVQLEYGSQALEAAAARSRSAGGGGAMLGAKSLKDSPRLAGQGTMKICFVYGSFALSPGL